MKLDEVHEKMGDVAKVLNSLRICAYPPYNCEGCLFDRDDTGGLRCEELLERKAAETIEFLQKDKESLELTLAGVMHSVDKWLDGPELELDEVNRAIRMREKTLDIVEDREKQIDELKQLLTVAKDDLFYILMKYKAVEGKLNGPGMTAMWELNQRNSIEKVEADWRKIFDYLEEKDENRDS